MPGRRRKPRRDSEKCAIINRTVSFNIEDPFQAKLLDAVDAWTNFSGNVKRLISASLDTQSFQPAQPVAAVVPTQEVAILLTEEVWNPLDDLI